MENDLSIIQRTVPKVASTVHIPLLSEVCLTVTGIVIALSAGGAAIASLLAQAPIRVVLLRTGVTILVVGLLGYLVNWLIGKYLINATLDKFAEELAVMNFEELDTQV
ncbi:MAG: hypothetical protein AB9891_08610 [Anaerolineaceae bacterium]